MAKTLNVNIFLEMFSFCIHKLREQEVNEGSDCRPTAGVK